MFVVISDDSVIVEIALPAGEQPWITARRTLDGLAKRATFNLGEMYEFDELHHAVRAIVDGVRPQLGV